MNLRVQSTGAACLRRFRQDARRLPVEHDAGSVDLHLRPTVPAYASGAPASGDPVTLFIGPGKGSTYRLTPAEQDTARTLIRAWWRWCAPSPEATPVHCIPSAPFELWCATATVGMLSASGGDRHSSFELATPTGALSQTQFTCKASDFTPNRRIGAGEFAGGANQGTVIHLPRARGDGAGDCAIGPVVPASGAA